jgi:hypothetical protein
MFGRLVIAILLLAGPARAADRNVFEDAANGVATTAKDAAHVLTSPLRMSGNDALEVGGILAATGLVMLLDDEIRDAVNRNTDEFPLKPVLEVGRFLDPVGYGPMNVYYFSGLGISYVTRWDDGTEMFGEIIESVAVTGLLKLSLQEVIGRARPFEDHGSQAFGYQNSRSFPSGHTMNAFLLATVISHQVNRPWATWGAYFCAVCVGLQRIDADAHWPSDVFLTAIGSTAITRAIISLHEHRHLAVTPRVGPEGLGLAVALGF